MAPSGASTSRPSTTFGRKTIAALVVAVTLAALALAATLSREPRAGEPGTTASASQMDPRPAGYFVTADELRERADLATAGEEPYRTAIQQLYVEADDAMRQEPRPRNPITHRGGRFLEDARNAYTLALASVASGRGEYARQSAEIIMAWVERTDATRDTCPDRGGSDCGTSLLLSRNAPALVFAADLLSEANVLSDEDVVQFRTWLAEVILPAASERANNWGDAGTFMRLVVSDYIGDDQAFAAAVDDWRASMDLVTSEGEIPEETRRGRLGLLYTQGAISYKAAAAAIAERRGIDLWSHEGSRGGSLRRAVDAFMHYWQNPAEWPWHDGRLEIPSVDPIWEIVYQQWPEHRIASILEAERPLGSENPSAVIWTTVTNAVPIDPG